MRYQPLVLLAIAAACATAGIALSAYHTAWSAGATQAEGVVEEPGPIPVVHFIPPKSKGEWPRVDTIGLRFYTSGQRVIVLFKTDASEEWDRSASIAGDHWLPALVCYGVAVACLLAAGGSWFGMVTRRAPVHGEREQTVSA